MNGGNSSLTVIGVCEVYSDGSKQVHMNQDWWSLNNTSQNAKKILVYHELGHCFFNGWGVEQDYDEAFKYYKKRATFNST